LAAPEAQWPGPALHGLRPGIYKPIETGVTKEAPDATALLKACQRVNPAFETLRTEDVTAYTFELPAAPYCADTKRQIDLQYLVDKHDMLQKKCDILLVEGAGGLMVPITETYLMIHLIKEIEAKALLVSSPYWHCAVLMYPLTGASISMKKKKSSRRLHNLITIQSFPSGGVSRRDWKSLSKRKQHRPPQLLKDKLLITLFFEPSTRTRSSFEVAAKRLGASVVHLDPSRSSTKKGESLEDTFANLCAMEPDGVIIRHEENEAPGQLANMQMTTVINAGAGNYAHPTQALLDLFTIKEHFGGDIEGKTIAIVGDIVNSRVASSGIRLLTRMGMKVVLVAPKPFLPQSSDLPQYENLETVLDKVDVIMSLRAQLERHKKPIFDDYEAYAEHYCITRPGHAQYRH